MLNLAQSTHELAEIGLEPSEIADEFAERRRIVGHLFLSSRNEIGSFLRAEILRRALRRGDGRLSASHGFQQRHSESFSSIGQNEGVASTIQRRQSRVFERIEERLHLWGVRIAGIVLDLLHQRIVPSHIRNQARINTNYLFIIRNRIYFSLENGRRSQVTP
jgi:hypothetical protein